MGTVIYIAALGVFAVATALAVTATRRHRHERREVEDMFSTETDDRVWWEERH